MKLFGTPSINPTLFFFGKISAVLLFIVLFLHLLGQDIVVVASPLWVRSVAYVLVDIGFIIALWSLYNLGKSTRIGLPKEKTQLQTTGIYTYSRNPMYVGVNLLTIAAMLITFNLHIAILGFASLLIHHLIILSEEKFLQKRFGKKYIEYCESVRRYI